MNGEGIKFIVSDVPSNGPSNIEALFSGLRKRDPQVPYLWAHQADIARLYHECENKQDIALELPTGAGKTLVGLLIAEWKRLRHGHRVVYLCPTRQLARQVGAKASEYGLRAHVLVGKQSEYPPASFYDYLDARAIAVTTYSGLFNTNPRISNPQTIILDDAHAATNYIAGMWSMTISRKNTEELYRRFVQICSDGLPGQFVTLLRDEEAPPDRMRTVDLVAGPKLHEMADQLSELLDAYVDGREDDDSDLSYRWQVLRGKLALCNVYFSWHEILIRPWIPPTLTHPPFEGAQQRIYMSATLGAGGELERITGIPSIHRIPVPEGWDRRGTGRRFFLFPDKSLRPEEYESWLAGLVRWSGRSLVLTPQNAVLEGFLDLLSRHGITYEVLFSKDIEDSLDVFTRKSEAVLALTGRYDGIDLPGDACRTLIVYGLPAAVNLQERFLWSRLGLTELLNDTIRTRVAQAAGRCTRNPADFACVVLVGGDLLEFCAKGDNRAGFHPELRAEIEFGLDNSDANVATDLSPKVKVFMGRGPDWDPAEADIIKRRDSKPAILPSYVKTLADVATLEVKYQYELWKESYDEALAYATQVIDKLSGSDLSGYRALWHYFAGNAAHLLSKLPGQDAMSQTASDHFRRAARAVKTVSWFTRLAHELKLDGQAQLPQSYLTALALEGIGECVNNLGTEGSKFERTMKAYAALMRQTDPDQFDEGLTQLGRMLGFGATRPQGKAAPDSIWELGGQLTVLFESKSGADPSGSVSVSTGRQAAGHLKWYQAHASLSPGAQVHTILVTPQRFLDDDARPCANGIFYVHIDSIRGLFLEAENFLRTVRAKVAGMEVHRRTEIIYSELRDAHLTPEDIVARLTKTSLSTLPAQ